MLIATAGHVDHGKTTLIRALTGTDCDRLKEEKRRGITISLGYAQWILPDETPVSVIDVPGHESLVRTMLAGAGGIDAVLIAISAESGIMPQTREHLNACWVLGVQHAVVAVTFSDRVDDLDRALHEIREGIRTTPYAQAAMIPVCAIDESGLAALGEAMSEVVKAVNYQERLPLPVCLPIDRVFSVDGHGTVVTGSLVRGQIERNATLSIIPGGRAVRVRSVQSHGETTDTALCGRRIAANLVVDRAQIKSASMLVEPDTVRCGRLFDAEIIWLPHNPRPLTRLRALTIYLGTSRTQADVGADGQILPGQSGTARIRLDRSIPLPPGFRFVLRGQPDRHYGAVVAGGRIIDARPRGRRTPDARQRLANASPTAQRAQIIAEAARGGITHEELVSRIPMETLSEAKLYIDPAAILETRASMIERIIHHHQNQPTLPGIPRAEFNRVEIHRRALLVAIEGGLLTVRDGYVCTPEHEARLNPELAKASRKIMRAVGRAGLSALSKTELVARFPSDETVIMVALRSLISQERVIISGGFCFPARELFALRSEVARHAVLGAEFNVAWLKGEAGVSRKHAIPLWTWLDTCGTTVRRGDLRIAGPMARKYANG
jgi:selenocysteine-specific elongation factor